MKKFISVLSSLCLTVTTLLTAFPPMSVSAAVPTDTKPATASGTMQFDILPVEGASDTDYTVGYDATAGMNMIEAKAGDDIYVGLYASSEPACAAQMVILDFSQVEYVLGLPEMASAYPGIAPTVNDLYANTADSLNQKYVSVVWAATADLKATAGEPVCMFEIKVPNKAATTKDLVYTIKETTAKVKTTDKDGNEVVKERSISVIGDPDINIPAKLYGLQIIVRAENPSEDTTQKVDGTTTKTPVSGDALEIDLLPMTGGNDKDYPVSVKSGFNNISAEPGDEIYLALYCSAKPACAAQMFVLDFSQVKYGANYAALAAAYTGIAPTVNDLYANKKDSMGQQYVSVVWAATADLSANPDEPVCVFQITVPDTKPTDKTLTYTIDKTTAMVKTTDKDGNEIERERSITIIGDPDIELPYTFRGLKINVAPQSSETTTAPDDTTAPTTTTTPKSVTPGGNAEWAIASTTVEAGAKVSLPVTAKSAGASGFVLDIDFASGLTLTDIVWANGYKGDIVVNKKDGVVVWADNTGADQTLTSSTKVLDLVFTAPTDAGDYAVTFKELTITNTDGSALTVKKTNGMITVEGTATTTAPTPAGDAQWKIASTTVEAGAKVSLPVTAKSAGASGFVLDIDYADGLTLNSIEWADGFSGDIVVNKKDVIVVWSANDGLDQELAAETKVLDLVFTAPTDAGDYPVTFKELSVVNTSGNALSVTKTNGMITVEGTATTTAPTPAGDAEWKIASTTVEAGAKVSLPVTAKSAGASGFVLDIDYADGLTLNSIEWADGFTGDIVVNKNDVIVVWSANDGLDQELAAETKVLDLVFTAPTAAGDYPVTFKELSVVNTSGNALNVTKTNGMITVLGETTTTTTTTKPVDSTTVVTTTTTMDTEAPVTTTTSTLAPGTVGWYIGSTTAAKGEQNVTVPVTVKNDPGTAGFVVDFKYDTDALTLAGIEWANGYTGDALINKDQLIVVWGSDDGLNQTAAEGAVVLNLIFNVKDDAAVGKHPVEFETITVQNTDQNEVTVVTVNGYIEIVDNTTTTTTTATTPKDTEEPGTTTTTLKETGEPGTTTTTTPKETGEPGTTTTTPKETGEPGTTTTTLKETGEPGTTTTTTPKDTEPAQVTTTTREPIVNPGHVVYYIGNVQGEPGETVKVPVSVVYDLGTAGFTMQFTVPDGFRIVGITYGDAYADTDEYMWNGSDYILVWNSPDGLDRIAADNSVIAYLEIQIPDNAEQDTVYPVEFGTVTAENTDGADLTPSLIPGSIYIKKIETTPTTTTVTTTEPPVVTTTTVTTPIPDPGNVVLNVGKETAIPGEQAEIPITVWFDDGTDQFTFKIDIPEGLTIDDVVFDPVYEENGTFTYDPETGTVTWKRNDDSDFVPTPGQEIAVIKITVPEEAEEGTVYPISLTDVQALDENGNPLEATVVPGSLTAGKKPVTTTTVTTTTAEIIPGTTTTVDTTVTTTVPGGSTTTTTATTTTPQPGDSTTTTTGTTTTVTYTTTTSGEFRYVTSYVTSFEAPTRVNYWSHDTRTFKESGGLKDLKASIVLYKFYIDADNNFVDANGTVLSDVKYTEGGELPVAAAFETKTADVTGITKPEADADSPIELWENEMKAQFGDAYVAPDPNNSEEQKELRKQQLATSQHQNKHTVPCYYFPTEQSDPDFVFTGEPIYFGEFQIFIGVKGDYDLNNVIDAKDAQQTLVYFAQTMVGNEVVMNANEEFDHSLETGKQEDGLIFYLVNVQYRVGGADSALENPPQIKATDSQMILTYFSYNTVTQIDRSWEDIVGYDLLDSFYGDTIE